MEANTSSVVGAPANGGKTNNQDEKSYRLIPATTVAELKRTMDGAETRKLRLKAERDACRAIISRKYADKFDDKKKNVIGQIKLNPAQLYGLKLKRMQLEKDLATAKGDFYRAQKAYRSAVSKNMQVERKTVKLIRTDNRLRRESKKLLKKTGEILEQHGSNGGANEMDVLTSLALEGDVKGFRLAFDEAVARFDLSHFTLISGVSDVKTEIIHGMMDQLAEDATKNQVNLTEAVQ
jgi:hypothetical protein